MSTAKETKACEACAKSKRKCGRQLPTCTRCQERSILCSYPPSRPTCWVLSDYMTPISAEGSVSPPQQPPKPVPQERPGDKLPQSRLPSQAQPESQSQDHPQSQSSPDLTLSDLQSAWFLTPETWDVHVVPDEDTREFTQNMDGVVKRYVSHLQSMVSDWVVKGSSAFIHSRLYQTRLPRHTQDAYTALSSYLTKSPETEQTVLRIVGERIDQLIADQPADVDSLDIFAHLGRVHALLVYIIIGLFDGDIHLRHMAESRLTTLSLWSYHMLWSARLAASSGQLLLGNLIDDGMQPSSPTQAEALWHAWVLAESARRTWLVSAGVRAAYRVLQDGHLQCNGGLMFTTRKGVWDATSAWAWTKLCAEQDVGFIPQAHTKRLFSEKKPDEIDEFGKMMLEVTYGTNKLESWGVWA